MTLRDVRVARKRKHVRKLKAVSIYRSRMAKSSQVMKASLCQRRSTWDCRFVRKQAQSVLPHASKERSGAARGTKQRYVSCGDAWRITPLPRSQLQGGAPLHQPQERYI